MKANYLAIVVKVIPRIKDTQCSFQPSVDCPVYSRCAYLIGVFTSELHIFRKFMKFTFQISREIDILWIVTPFEQLLSLLNFFFSLLSNCFGLFICDKQCWRKQQQQQSVWLSNFNHRRKHFSSPLMRLPDSSLGLKIVHAAQSSVGMRWKMLEKCFANIFKLCSTFRNGDRSRALWPR